MRAHVIKDGKVVNTIEVESLDFMPNLKDASQGGKIGDLYDEVTGTYSEPAAPSPSVPESVTRRQGLQQLLLEGYTEANIEALIQGLAIPDLQKQLALIEFKTSQTFERYRPLTIQLAQLLGKDSAWLDQMFINAKKLP